jgi:F5/8 type C domain
LNYHGHKLTVVLDKEGTKYHAGKGMMIYVDGEKVSWTKEGDKYKVDIGSTKSTHSLKSSPNYALNIAYKGFPQPSASVNSVPDSLFQAVDGRIWYFPEIRNRWSTQGSTSTSDWFAIDFGQPREISEVKIYPFVDKITFGIPDEVSIEYKNGEKWIPVKIKQRNPERLIANTGNSWIFEKVNSTMIRINFKHLSMHTATSEVECY